MKSGRSVRKTLMRALLILNPVAGGNSPLQADLLQQTARMMGATLDIAIPHSPKETDATVHGALATGYDRILCAGGDGTLNRIASILVGTEMPLAIIPTGTANVLARELHLPLDPVQALRIALQGQLHRIDVGRANDHYFLLMAGFGFDAQVVSEIVPRLKELFGPFTYVATGLQVLARYKPSLFHLEVDGTSITLPAWLVVVGNAGYYGYQVTLAPEARLDDGMLDVCLFAERNALDRLTQISAIFVGQHMKHPNVSYFRARHVQITADPPVSVQLDGDPAGVSPVDISVQPSSLIIVTPHASI